jgi:hypothetical protein
MLVLLLWRGEDGCKEASKEVCKEIEEVSCIRKKIKR